MNANSRNRSSNRFCRDKFLWTNFFKIRNMYVFSHESIWAYFFTFGLLSIDWVFWLEFVFMVSCISRANTKQRQFFLVWTHALFFNCSGINIERCHHTTMVMCWSVLTNDAKIRKFPGVDAHRMLFAVRSDCKTLFIFFSFLMTKCGHTWWYLNTWTPVQSTLVFPG